MARLAALLLLPVLFEAVFSISFFLPVNSRKCLREEIHKDVLVTGEYEIAEQANTKTNLKVSTDLRVLSVNVTSWNRGQRYCTVWCYISRSVMSLKDTTPFRTHHDISADSCLDSPSTVVSTDANLGPIRLRFLVLGSREPAHGSVRLHFLMKGFNI